MNVIALLESVSRADGGIFEAELSLQRELALGQGIHIDIIGLEDQYTVQDIPRWLPLQPRVVKTRGPEALGFSPDLLPALDPKADLLYAATLWKYPSWAAVQWAERTGKPMMVAPHGSLDAWALRNAAWKKRIAAALYKNRQLRKASCLRALCLAEANAFRAYGLTNPIAIIPNGVTLQEGESTKLETANLKLETGGRKMLLFLGRLHPKKGLANLIRGFKEALDARSSTPDSSWQLVIAGWDQGGHEAELIRLCEELEVSFSHKMHKERKAEPTSGFRFQVSGFSGDVVFWGAAYGNEKKDLLRRADAFILPSFSEGLPMSVLEAWAHGLPVMMTPECNLPEGFAAEAAIRIGTAVESIVCGLTVLFSMNAPDLASMGSKGRALVEKHFTWKTVGRHMREVYDWMLGGGEMPACVVAGRGKSRYPKGFSRGSESQRLKREG